MPIFTYGNVELDLDWLVSYCRVSSPQQALEHGGKGIARQYEEYRGAWNKETDMNEDEEFWAVRWPSRKIYEAAKADWVANETHPEGPSIYYAERAFATRKTAERYLKSRAVQNDLAWDEDPRLCHCWQDGGEWHSETVDC